LQKIHSKSGGKKTLQFLSNCLQIFSLENNRYGCDQSNRHTHTHRERERDTRARIHTGRERSKDALGRSASVHSV